MTQPTTRAGVIRIVIADDHAIVRDGLRSLIEAQPGLEVVGEAGDGDEAWRRACELKPDVLLLDLSMPRVTGIDGAERIARDCPGVRILALTAHEERGYVTRLLGAGAAGYLVKRTAGAELVRAIRVVAAGGTYVDPSIAAALLVEPARGAPGAAGPGALTPREAEVLQLVVRGHLNKEIAASLAIGVKTVETHKANAMAKLGLTSRAALVRFALDQGWLAED
ncbi:response regulator [Roseisolibacter agri]|uniref:DNA-binding response regulator n=1 Tax=Roseisolibacter agri TaxID=2014610 RepID=A0AA37QI78_9BACT|nr:response regulator transcription factor [Roseisolibacter agri]GLC26970.1 DNA-binding response regulator [Roseisolibacter agri]